MAAKLREFILPLYIVSKFFCTHPFSRKPLKTSFWGSTITLVIAIGYSVFHLTSAKRDMNMPETGANANFVATIIDSFNRYSGFCNFCVLVIASIAVQGKIVRVIELCEDVDNLFKEKYNIIVDNYTWSR